MTHLGNQNMGLNTKIHKTIFIIYLDVEIKTQ